MAAKWPTPQGSANWKLGIAIITDCKRGRRGTCIDYLVDNKCVNAMRHALGALRTIRKENNHEWRRQCLGCCYPPI